MQVHIAYLGVFIPPIHGIDGLRQLCTALLVNAACMGPQALISILLSLLTALDDLSIAITLVNFISLLPVHLCKPDHVIIVHFLHHPLMGQDHVLCCFIIAKLEDFGVTIHWLSLFHQTLPLEKGFYIDQAHAVQVHICLNVIVNFG